MGKPVKECITVAKQFDGDMVLFKNRDRNYKPRLKIVRDSLNSMLEEIEEALDEKKDKD